MTWDEIYEKAMDTGFGDPKLRAKDNARFEMRGLFWEGFGEDIEKAECPEEDIDYFLDTMKERYEQILEFDENGHIEGTKFFMDDDSRSNKYTTVSLKTNMPLLKATEKLFSFIDNNPDVAAAVHNGSAKEHTVERSKGKEEKVTNVSFDVYGFFLDRICIPLSKHFAGSSIHGIWTWDGDYCNSFKDGNPVDRFGSII